MELKYGVKGRPFLGGVVLIVPLWNWNVAPADSIQEAESFNRTFMELKWNGAKGTAAILHVLIVPLWNWNERTQKVHGGNTRFNRTFMELKCQN